MPKQFLDSDKKKWLELYEAGQTERQIAKDHTCDARTIRRGIREARLRQDAKVARTELLKDALRKHQDTLLKELDVIVSHLTIPKLGASPISWNRSGESILSEAEALIEKYQEGDFQDDAAAFRQKGGTVRRLLKEHLKNDRLWKVLSRREKANAAHDVARLALQHKLVSLIQQKTGCKVLEEIGAPGPHVVSYTTGNLFFEEVVRIASDPTQVSNLQNYTLTDATQGTVRFSGSILAEAPGAEEKVKDGLFDALREMEASPEAASVVKTHGKLTEATTTVREVVEEIKLLGMIPGHCEICRRLGM